MNQLVIGAGEVGQALGEVLEVPVLDVHYDEGDELPKADLLHIAFPWSNSFREEVDRYDDMYMPEIIVVHSTVPIGTCDASGWLHSPVRGRHPDLAEGIRTFTKHVGGGTAEQYQLVQGVFMEAYIPNRWHERAATTEAGKLFELARLGVEVRVQKEIQAYCEQYGLPFSEVYGEFTETYNLGFEILGERQFMKPDLKPVPGPLGGHCVAQNTPMLGSEFFIDLVRPVSPEGWAGDLP